jgi:hypothetical protein
MRRFSVKKWLKLYRTDSDGSVLTEAAFILPFLSALGLGAVDASFMLLQNHKMEQALVSAANFMSQSQTPLSFEGQAKTLAVTGSLDTGASPILKDWKTSDITISYRLIPNANADYRGGDYIRVIELNSVLPYQGFGIIKSIRGSNPVLKASYQQRLTGELS